MRAQLNPGLSNDQRKGGHPIRLRILSLIHDKLDINMHNTNNIGNLFDNLKFIMYTLYRWIKH
jgi:hypothetical protein